MPREVLEAIFLASYVTYETEECKTWTLTSCEAIAAAVAPLLAVSGYVCVGSTKAFRTKSQRAIRVVACLIPDFEISHAKTKEGLDRAHLAYMYVLATEHGELHWPKDSERREISFDAETELSVREHILSDILQMANQGEPLAPGWWRQLGNHSKADEVEAELSQPRPRSTSRRASSSPSPSIAVKKEKKVRRCRFTKETFEIEQIVAEKKVNTKEQWVFLVRWSSYDPSWEGARISGEPGSPLETWEPLLLVKDTEALVEWRARPRA
jgi:hypothetical protein